LVRYLIDHLNINIDQRYLNIKQTIHTTSEEVVQDHAGLGTIAAGVPVRVVGSPSVRKEQEQIYVQKIPTIHKTFQHTRVVAPAVVKTVGEPFSRTSITEQRVVSPVRTKVYQQQQVF
jgi:hypothetical protein